MELEAKESLIQELEVLEEVSSLIMEWPKKIVKVLKIEMSSGWYSLFKVINKIASRDILAPVLTLSVRLHSLTSVTLLDLGGYGGYGGGFYPGAAQKAAKRGMAVDWKCLVSQLLH